MSLVNIFIFRCDKCGQEYQVAQIPRYYDFDNQNLRIGCRPAWCGVEKTMVEAEDFGELEEFKEILASLEMEAKELDEADGEGLDEEGREELEEWRQGVRWRSLRRSPRRCLACGSTDVQLVPHGAESGELRHPSCGGVIALRSMDLKELNTPPLIYTVEGRRITDE